MPSKDSDKKNSMPVRVADTVKSNCSDKVLNDMTKKKYVERLAKDN